MSALTVLRAVAPAAALALFAFGPGTFTSGASAAGAAAGHVVVLAAALYAARGWSDPLRLGRRGRWLVAALAAVVVASWLASPVERAGRVAVLTLPAWLMAPAAVARCWRDDRARRLGTTAVAAVVLAAAAAALVGRLIHGDPRASAPLGHHNLLAVWLLALLPLGLRPAGERGVSRWLALAAGACGLAALALSGSLSGYLGLAAVAVAGALLLARSAGPRWVAPAVLVVAAGAVALALPRLASVLGGSDPSLLARRTYWAAGWRGFLARPALGWGPGAVPWTVGEWMRPVPGVNPPGQVVGDLHSLPLHLAYELGTGGLLLAAAVGALFVVTRWRRGVAGAGGDRRTVTVALAGLVAAGVAMATVAPLTVTAVPAALAVAAGAALLGERSGERPPARWPVWVYALLVLLPLARLDLAHWHHDRSLSADRPEARELATAVRLDPAFPLYRFRLALLEGRAAEAAQAGAGAPGVGALWLAAGALAAGDGAPWAAGALERACRLDPLAAAAPFFLADLDPGAAAAPRRAGRALLAEPRLAAARRFEEREGLLAAAVDEVRRWPGVSAGWRRAFVDTVTGWDVEVPGDVAHLELRADAADPSGSLSLHAFRRRPRPLVLARFALRSELARQVVVPPAAVLAETSPRAFAPSLGCTAGDG